jgi:tagatose 1,6-diphosphate aldolase
MPWVILSAGADYPTLKTQVEIACKAGASGYVAGRSIWRDAASVKSDDKNRWSRRQ